MKVKFLGEIPRTGDAHRFAFEVDGKREEVFVSNAQWMVSKPGTKPLKLAIEALVRKMNRKC